eukprot:361810-Rhodomonas_salina.2
MLELESSRLVFFYHSLAVTPSHTGSLPGQRESAGDTLSGCLRGPGPGGHFSMLRLLPNSYPGPGAGSELLLQVPQPHCGMLTGSVNSCLVITVAPRP